MIIRSLLIILALTIAWKYLWSLWNKTSPWVWKWILRLALFCIAFFLPIFWLQSMHGNSCIGWKRLLPSLLSAWLLYTYFLRPTNCSSWSCGWASSQWPIKPLTPSSWKRDDLKKIEWIGPKIEQLLFDYWITTFETLAQTDPTHIKKILVQWWDNFKNHEPNTWPMQAQLAHSWKWEVLDTLQEELKWGKFV